MNKPWLTASLTVIILLTAGIGIRHEAHVNLERGLSRFQDSLPPGTTFAYGTAKPAILTRSAILHEVVLHSGNSTFRAATVRIGHPQTTADGGLKLTSLDLDAFSLQSPTYLVHGDTLSLHRLVLPPTSFTTSDIEPAALTQLSLGHIALAQGRVTHLTYQSVSPPTPGQVHLYSTTADDISVSHYGPGEENTSLTLTAGKAALSDTPLPYELPSLPTQVSLQTFSLQDFPLAAMINSVQEKIPMHMRLAQTIQIPGRLALSDFQISDMHNMFRLDRLQTDHNIATATGLHLHFQNMKSPIHIDGTRTTIRETISYPSPLGPFSTVLHLNIPSLVDASLTTLMTMDETTKKLAWAKGTLSLQGDHFINVLYQLASHKKPDDPTLPAFRQQTAMTIGSLLTPYPGLAPISAYLANPQGKTLTISFTPATPISLDDFQNARGNSTFFLRTFTPDTLKADTR